MALEYDEDEIGDLEEQGHEIRGFADVAGERCMGCGIQAGGGDKARRWTQLCSHAAVLMQLVHMRGGGRTCQSQYAFLSAPPAVSIPPSEFDNLLDEFLEVHGQSRAAHEVRCGCCGHPRLPDAHAGHRADLGAAASTLPCCLPA